jgi:hypothetical protein
MRRIALACLACLPLFAQAAAAVPAGDTWFSVLLDGRKIGSFENRREVEGVGAQQRVLTTQKLDLVLDRAGVRLALGTEETSEETPTGTPLAFSSVSRLSGSATRIDGSVRDGWIDVTVQNGPGTPEHRRSAWPDGALLPEGLRLAGVRAGLEPGTHYRSLAFQPSSLDAVPVDTVVGSTGTVDLPNGPMQLTEIRQTLDFPGAPASSRAWVDADQTVHKLVMPMLGVNLTLLACGRACAQAANQDTDLFARMLVASPIRLSVTQRRHALRYELIASDDGPALDLPVTGEQQVARRPGGLVVTVDADAAATSEAPPTRADRVPNDWLQSRDPKIMALARRGAGSAATPLARMQTLESFVRSYIQDKSLGVGYASALEVARKPEGDCTEHAVLLAALGRALGIPTRVVDGLAYADGFAGAQSVFVPHAWVQAWIDGRWQSFDAALAGFDTGHIALSVGDGDPWRFYAGLGALGRIRLESVSAPATPLPQPEH